jgi:hypothetical protein
MTLFLCSVVGRAVRRAPSWDGFLTLTQCSAQVATLALAHPWSTVETIDFCVLHWCKNRPWVLVLRFFFFFLNKRKTWPLGGGQICWISSWSG